MCNKPKEEFAIVEKNEIIKFIKGLIRVAYSCNDGCRLKTLLDTVDYLPLIPLIEDED